MTSAPDGNGGIAARRAVGRWALRLFRREWRQQVLVLAMLSVAVTAAVGAVCAAPNVVSLRAASFGSANQRIVLKDRDPVAAQADIAAAEAWFGTIDVIGSRTAPIEGSVDTVDIRAQNPDGAYSGPMLRVHSGRYPSGAGEIAVTDGVASTLDVGLGASLTIDGRQRTVVGIVENPSDLDDEFALVSASSADPPNAVTILVRSSRDRAESFRGVDASAPFVETRGQTERGAAAAVVFGLATIVLLLISFIAAAGFAVVAQRRLRQLGMLAAIGATEKHLRLAMLASGAVIGAVSAAVGAAIGLAIWFATAPRLETFAHHRIDRLDVPWLVIAASMLLAVATSTSAAWWPARTVARIPITLALSARPPRPKPAHRSAVAAAVLLAVGFACLGLARQTNGPLISAGAAAIALGILFVSPLAVRALATVATRLPIAARLALRDLARNQARSGAALAAISLALGIPIAVVIIASAAQQTANEGNLSDRQLMVRVGGEEPFVPVRTPAEIESARSAVDRIVANLDHPAVLALQAAVNPAAKETTRGQEILPVVGLGKQVGPDTLRDVGTLYVATPEVDAHFGLDLGSIGASVDVLTGRAGDLSFTNVPVPDGTTKPVIEPIDVPAYTSAPSSFITPDSLDRHGWAGAPAAWFVETAEPLTGAQRAAAREIAESAGLTVEARQQPTSIATTRSVATAAGVLLALIVLAMTIGLIRSEGAGDLRILTASGATTSIRRSLTAATAAALALLGVLLGTIGAYIGLVGGYLHQLSALSRVPVLQLGIMIVGVPLLAAAVGWLAAGREPPSLRSQPF